MRFSAPEVERVWTVLDIVKWGTEYFERKGMDSPRLTIELMLCHVLSVRRLQLYTDHERPLSKEELSTLRSFVQRRAAHEPLQYILHKAEFYGLTFEVGAGVLIPRPETELIVERGIRFLKEHVKEPQRCLDIGTGSGCIPISIAVHIPNSQWICTDISPEALSTASRNAQIHGVDGRIEFQLADLFVQNPQGPFDLITMNPPYIPLADMHELEPEVKEHEPHRALTDDLNGLTFYHRFAQIATGLIAPVGLALLEIGFEQASDIASIMKGATLDCSFINDLENMPRVAKISMPCVTM